MDFHTHAVTEGGRWIRPEIRREHIPVYIREDALIPMSVRVPEDSEAPYGEMELVVHLASKYGSRRCLISLHALKTASASVPKFQGSRGVFP